MTWLVLFIEWLDRKLARLRALDFEDCQFAAHLIETTSSTHRRKGKW